MDKSQVRIAIKQTLVQLTGAVYAELLPLLDGRHNIEQIITVLEGRWNRRDVLQSIHHLHKLNILCDSLLPANNHTLQLINLSDADDADLISALEKIAISVTTQLHPYAVVLVDDYLDDRLNTINQQFRNNGTQWLLAKCNTTDVWIGPVFHPNTSFCWNCVAITLKTIAHTSYKRIQVNTALNDSTRLGYAHVSQVVAHWLMQILDTHFLDAIRLVDTASYESQWCPVPIMGDCDICGQHATNTNMSQNFILSSRRKCGFAEVGHRTQTPSQILADYGYLLNPVTGISNGMGMRRIHENPLIHVYSAGFAVAPYNSKFPASKDIIHFTGKGINADLAKASALGEAVERFSAVYRGIESTIEDRYSNLSDCAIAPNDLLLYSNYQRSRQDHVFPSDYDIEFINQVHESDLPIAWCSAFSLINQKTVYIPACYCYLRYDASECACVANTNGCSAGSTVEEAILSGIFEIVERDSIAIWWYNQIVRPAIEISHTASPYFHAVAELLQTHGRYLYLLDLTTDLNITTVAAISYRIDAEEQDIIMGFGCHLDPIYAVQRAITEHNQSLVAVWSRTLDPEATEFATADKRAIHWWLNGKLEDNPCLVSNPQETHTITSANAITSLDVLDEIKICIRMFERSNQDILVHNLTRLGINMPVVKVISPGLRHLQQRFAPGRLYQVPITMGWIPHELAESSLNSKDLYFA